MEIWRGEGRVTGEKVMDRVEEWWIHIGKNFIKDMIRSKDMGIQSVWCQKLVLDRVWKEEEKAPVPAPPALTVDKNGGESGGGVEKILAKT